MSIFCGEKGETLKKTRKKDFKNFTFKKYLKPYSLHCVLGPFAKAIETATEVVIPMLMSNIIDIGIANQDKPYIYKLAGIILFLNVLAVICAVICQKSSTLLGEGVAKDLRGNLYKHINTFSYSELDGFTPASLVNRTINDVNQVESAISMTIRWVTRVPFLLIGSVVMAIIIDLQMSLIFLAVAPTIGLIMYFITRKTFPYYEKFKVELDQLSNITRENLSGVRVVRAFNKENYETERFEKSNNSLTAINSKVVKITSVLHPIIFMVIQFSTIAIVYWGGVRVEIGQLSTGNVIAFINYFTQISAAFITVARIIIVYTRTSAAVKRINDVFNVKNSIVNPTNPFSYKHEDNKKSGAKISFENVSFSYGSTKNAVENLSFSLEAGQTLGIIGGTGSGKTSVVNLIPRLYDATKGTIKIDGINVKEYKLEDLRKIVGIVPQEMVLFEGTIESNLKWRNEKASEFELIKALKIAQAYDFVKEKPKFLKASVNRGGKNFSGGQKQRLTIARALIGHPRIVILDDSSSALDLATDAKLRKALNTQLKNVTKIFVSQRATSLMNADKIIVMEDGKAVDIGSHDELLNRCNLYKEICYSQNKASKV